MKKIKAIVLLSGGLDSTLAAKLVLNQGIEVVGLNFESPFCTCNREGRCEAKEVSDKLKIPLVIKQKGLDYFNKTIRNPKHGYGRHMNPCIDCRIFILKEAKKFMKKIGAKFIITGEVLNQRPMSQYKKAMELIEKESGLKEKILRPLSAKLLPETEAEKKEWIDRKKLLNIQGRRRVEQIELAKKFKIEDFKCPGGGCLLTYKEFAKKVKDLLKYNKKVGRNDIILLKHGRHFRINKTKIIIGRNEKENNTIKALKKPGDILMEVMDIPGPITLIRGPKTKKAIKIAARLTVKYSDAKNEVFVEYNNKKIKVKALEGKDYII